MFPVVETRPAPVRAPSVLVVCTGNVCRSPVAERLLAARLGDAVVVRSAGTRALAGEPMDAAMARLLEAAGADPCGFVARQLTPVMLERADLVLTLTRQHRSASVALFPASVRRAFLVLEFASLVSAGGVEVPRAPLSVEGLRMTISRATAGRTVPPFPEVYDVPDPYRGPAADYLTAFGRIERAVDTIAAVLGGVAQRSQPPSLSGRE